VSIFGWAGAAFVDWMPKVWIAEVREDKFAEILESLRAKREWLRTTASEIFDDDAMKFLFDESGTILNAVIVLMSTGNEDGHFDLVSRMGTLEIGIQNAQDPSNALLGFPWDDFSCALDARLLMELVLAEALGEIRYREAAEGGSEILARVTEATLGLANTPSSNRSMEMMQAHRESIRQEISRETSLKFNLGTSLQAFEQHIAPSRLIEFGITMERSCLGSHEPYHVRLSSFKKMGMQFDIRHEQAYRSKSLQDVLTYIVCLFLWGNAERSGGGRVLERGGDKALGNTVLPNMWQGKSL
jgi:hypothetical protein